MVTLEPCLNNYTKRRILYSTNEKAIDTVPKQNSDIALLIAYVNIGFDSDNMCANQIWGFSPKESWIEQKLSLPMGMKGNIRLIGDYDYGSWRLDRNMMWKTFFDEQIGWICIGNHNSDVNTLAIQFIEDGIFVLNSDRELHSLWLKPTFN